MELGGQELSSIEMRLSCAFSLMAALAWLPPVSLLWAQGTPTDGFAAAADSAAAPADSAGRKLLGWRLSAMAGLLAL
jgi:hypothetical protein